MNGGWVEFGIGLLAGGLALSACWGLFWLIIGTIGISRGTCNGRVIVNSLTVGVVPLMLMAGMWWWQGADRHVSSAFGWGLLGMPVVLFGLGLRQAPDGQRAGLHMLEGVRHLMDQLLGRHHDCGGCGEAHQHKES
jgi:hypothetical protein